MTRADLTEKILDIKRENGWTWSHICGEIGGMSPILIVGALLGQMKLAKPQAAKAADLFGLSTATRKTDSPESVRRFAESRIGVSQRAA